MNKYCFITYFGSDLGVYKTHVLMDLPAPAPFDIIREARNQLPAEWLIGSVVLQII